MMKRTRILARQRAARADSVVPSFLRASEAAALARNWGTIMRNTWKPRERRQRDGGGRRELKLSRTTGARAIVRDASLKVRES